MNIYLYGNDFSQMFVTVGLSNWRLSLWVNLMARIYESWKTPMIKLNLLSPAQVDFTLYRN